jgi:general L-amino acid transport system substrate-binding protein
MILSAENIFPQHLKKFPFKTQKQLKLDQKMQKNPRHRVRRCWRSVFGLILGLALQAGQIPTASASTLETVRSNGDIRCGVFANSPGRSAIDANGIWRGFYVDFCRAVAAAVLGNPDYVRYVEVEYKTRFTSLQNRDADVVMFSTTWTIDRELRYGVSFPIIYLYDGQGVMVRKSSGVTSLEGLKDKTVCAKENTTSYENFKSLIDSKGWPTEIRFLEKEFFFRGQCDAYTADMMNLATSRANRAEDADNYILLPDILSREPLGPMVRNDDLQWNLIIRSVIQALMLAEANDITQANIDQRKVEKNGLEIATLFSAQGTIAQDLGLNKEWAIHAIKAVGNYAEVYERNLGPKTPIGVPRGRNQSSEKGGLFEVPLFR